MMVEKKISLTEVRQFLSVDDLIKAGGEIISKTKSQAPMPGNGTDYIIKMPDGKLVYKTE